MNDYNWKYVWNDGSMDGGEFYGTTIFYDSNSQRYSVRDMSGELPEDTDDGVLWLDFDRNFNLFLWDEKIMLKIPLVTVYGDECDTFCRAYKLDKLLDVLRENNIKPDITMTPEVQSKIQQALRIHECYENAMLK